MRVIWARLEHFGPHASLDFAPSPHLTGVVGPTGAGKSSLLAGLELLVTGQCALPGPKDANVSVLAPTRAASRVVGVLEHDGHRLELVRGLRHAKTELRVDGGQAVLGEIAVNAELASLCGASLALYGDYVFVKQARLYSFLEETEARRAAVYGQLFGLKRLESLRRLLGERLATIRVTRPTAELDVLRRRVADGREKLAGLRAAKAAYADLRGYSRDADPNAAAVAAHESGLRRRAALAEAEAELEEASGAVAECLALRSEARARLAAARAVHRAAAAAAAHADEACAVYNALDRHVLEADACRARIAGLETSIRDAAAPPRPDGDEEALRRRRADVAAALRRDTDAANACVDGVASCPTCGQDVPDAAALRAELRARCRAHGREMDEIDRALDAWRVFDESYRSYAAGVAAGRRALGDAAAALARLGPAPTPPTRTRAEVEGALAAAGRAARDVESAEAVCRRVGDVFDAKSEALGRAADAHAEAAASAPPEVDEAAYRAALAALDATGRRLRAYGELVGLARGARAQLEDDEAGLARLESEAAESARSAALAARLEAMRGALHYTAIPRRIASDRLARIEVGVNAMLDRFEADFRVRTRPDQSFEAVFSDGVRQPAARLSGGQKVLLAIAFRVEINSLFTHDIGLLCLDEPTEFLDGRNVGCLDVALGQLRLMSAANGLQCVVVTHDESLGRLFDEVVTIGGR